VCCSSQPDCAEIAPLQLPVSPLYRRRFYTALIVSCAAGAVVDSALFLWLVIVGWSTANRPLLPKPINDNP
jgi:hypothetical protein